MLREVYMQLCRKNLILILCCRTALINLRMEVASSVSLILQTLRQVSLMALLKNKAHY